ncbi:MAG: hypothetical protein HY731_08755 [Candidatus Tectomicrobia bacterium]|nr:hypothetical protein [Candidatus Tectomicrobia bacterium]
MITGLIVFVFAFIATYLMIVVGAVAAALLFCWWMKKVYSTPQSSETSTTG